MRGCLQAQRQFIKYRTAIILRTYMKLLGVEPRTLAEVSKVDPGYLYRWLNAKYTMSAKTKQELEQGLSILSGFDMSGGLSGMLKLKEYRTSIILRQYKELLGADMKALLLASDVSVAHFLEWLRRVAIPSQSLRLIEQGWSIIMLHTFKTILGIKVKDLAEIGGVTTAQVHKWLTVC